MTHSSSPSIFPTSPVKLETLVLFPSTPYYSFMQHREARLFEIEFHRTIPFLFFVCVLHNYSILPRLLHRFCSTNGTIRIFLFIFIFFVFPSIASTNVAPSLSELQNLSESSQLFPALPSSSETLTPLPSPSFPQHSLTILRLNYQFFLKGKTLSGTFSQFKIEIFFFFFFSFYCSFLGYSPKGWSILFVILFHSSSKEYFSTLLSLQLPFAFICFCQFFSFGFILLLYSLSFSER